MNWLKVKNRQIIVRLSSGGAQSKNIVIYHRGERRVRRVLRLFQSLLRFFGASAFSVCSAVKFENIYSNFTEKFDSSVRR
uniref:Uncharacterized protein n=1 Tax=Candidatus Methanophagaceae archaeon ANME-1 ERB6 TaxID=2759912 RepID=A0A7G9YVW4_9EURY|nr:hypothetical protein MDNCFBIC_00018 [Methanosarcinales archaeon ANME-1 ERB6]